MDINSKQSVHDQSDGVVNFGGSLFSTRVRSGARRRKQKEEVTGEEKGRDEEGME